MTPDPNGSPASPDPTDLWAAAEKFRLALADALAEGRQLLTALSPRTGDRRPSLARVWSGLRALASRAGGRP